MSQAVATVSPIVEVIKRVQRDIKTMRDTAHILTPMARTEIDGVAVGKIPVLRIATISSDPKDHEVYELKQPKGLFALSKVGLMRLEAMAGITGWKTQVEHIAKAGPDGHMIPDPLHVKATAYAEIEDIDGSKRGKPQTFELNLNDGSPQSEKMIKIEEGGRKNDKELKQQRINIVQMAESKAMNRVRRDLLNLQSTFTKDELKKPFVIMRLVDAPLDPTNPLIKKLLIMKQLNISAEMYETAAQEFAVQTNPAQGVIDVTPEPEANKPTDPVLVSEVESLYKYKIKGGRAANKVSLDKLSNEELNKLKEILNEMPDLPGIK